MASSFQNWSDAWGNSWGSVVTDPNAMRGGASFTFTAALQVNAGEMQGSASFSISAALQLVEPPHNFSQEVNLSRKWYVKRGKKLHIFATAQDADAFLEAEQAAQEAVAKAKKTSRLARKRVLKAFKLDALPTQTIQIDALESLVDRYQLPVSLPSLIAQQDWEQVVRIMLEVQQMQDEEDLEMLLLA
jgi:hypothetical protein